VAALPESFVSLLLLSLTDKDEKLAFDSTHGQLPVTVIEGLWSI